MPKTMTLSLAVIIASFVIGNGMAQARGGNEDIDSAREALRAEQAQIRAQTGATNTCQNASLWDMMFGHDEATAQAAPAPSGS